MTERNRMGSNNQGLTRPTRNRIPIEVNDIWGIRNHKIEICNRFEKYINK
jgi:hypothetical protein